MSEGQVSADRERWNEIAKQDIDYHSRQFREPYRSTVELARFIQSYVLLEGGTALDVGCGAGANIYHLSGMLPRYRWTGLDLAGDVLFPVGRPELSRRGVDAELVVGDFRNLRRTFADRRFDLVLILQTVMATSDWENLLDQSLALTKGWLFLNSLFTDFLVDAHIQIYDYTWPADRRGPHSYNVFSLERLRTFCQSRGCKEFVTQDFEIDVDLARPESRGMGSYTQTLADGKRLQFSGPLLLPWKFVGVRMGSA